MLSRSLFLYDFKTVLVSHLLKNQPEAANKIVLYWNRPVKLLKKNLHSCTRIRVLRVFCINFILIWAFLINHQTESSVWKRKRKLHKGSTLTETFYHTKIKPTPTFFVQVYWSVIWTSYIRSGVSNLLLKRYHREARYIKWYRRFSEVNKC